jgi:hypothetical protein
MAGPEFQGAVHEFAEHFWSGPFDPVLIRHANLRASILDKRIRRDTIFLILSVPELQSELVKPYMIKPYRKIDVLPIVITLLFFESKLVYYYVLGSKEERRLFIISIISFSLLAVLLVDYVTPCRRERTKNHNVGLTACRLPRGVPL